MTPKEICKQIDQRRSKEYLKWLRDQRCIANRAYEGQCEAAHTFKSVHGGGVAFKSTDETALPLSPAEHRKQSGMSEMAYWQDVVARDPVLLKKMVGAFAKVYYYDRFIRETGGE